MSQIDCIRKGDWRDLYPSTVDRLYAWGAWRLGDESGAREIRGYTGLGYPSIQPMFINREVGYRSSMESVFEYSGEEAIETDQVVWMSCDDRDKTCLVFYYSDRYTYQDLGASLSQMELNAGRKAIADKIAKEWVGHAVAKVDNSLKMLKTGRLTLPEGINS